MKPDAATTLTDEIVALGRATEPSSPLFWIKKTYDPDNLFRANCNSRALVEGPLAG